MVQISAEEVLEELYKKFSECKGKINVLHVDAEGFDWAVVQSFLKMTRPELIVFESKRIQNNNDTNTPESKLRRMGYTTWGKNHNTFALKLFQ